MSDRDALLAAVLAAPDDDLPRLVFADWLEETSHPAHAARARFIRLQIAAETAADRKEFDRQAEELFALYGAGWQAELLEWVGWRDTEVSYRRGFVEKVTATPRRLCRDGHELFAVAPITEVRLRSQIHYTGRNINTTLFEPEFYERVRVLTFGPRLWLPAFLDPDHRVPTAYLLLASKRFLNLQHLVVTVGAVTDEWVVRFASGYPSASFAGSLTQLDLSHNEITDAGANTLATARGLDRLSRLVLTGNRITEAGAAMLHRRFGDRVLV